MIVFEGIAVGVGLILVLSHLIERISGPVGLLSPWTIVIVTAAVFSFYASARSLQIGDGVAVIAVTSVAANLSTIVAGLAVFGDRLGNDALVVGVRVAAFAPRAREPHHASAPGVATPLPAPLTTLRQEQRGNRGGSLPMSG
jgi:hypothetical protein